MTGRSDSSDQAKVRELRAKLAAQRAMNSAAAARQHRKPPASLASEYCHVFTVTCSATGLEVLRKWTQGCKGPSVLGNRIITKLHKLLSYQAHGGEGQLVGQEGGLVSCRIGVARTPVQFMHEALKVERPLIAASLGSADDLLRNIFLTLTMWKTAVSGRRVAFVKKSWSSWPRT